MTEFQEQLLKKLDLIADQQHIIISKLDEMELYSIDGNTEQTARQVKNLNKNFLKAFQYYHTKKEDEGK